MALNFPEKTDGFKGAVTFTVISEATPGDGGSTTGSGTVSSAGESCTLYLPSGLQIADKVTYENADLGAIGQAVESGLLGQNAADAQVQSYLDTLGQSTSANDKGLGSLMVAGITKKFEGGVAAAVSSANRVALNPNTRALFKNVQLRSFQFTFKLVPTSRSENTNITEIIRFFREELYPEKVEGNLGYKFPNKFDISFTYGDTAVGTKLRPCYLESFSATYNSSTNAMHDDGGFSEVDITLGFMEGRALSRADIKAGF